VVLLKCFRHNLSVMVRAIHELRIEPTFWARVAMTVARKLQNVSDADADEQQCVRV
jgi:hypothetical protein